MRNPILRIYGAMIIAVFTACSQDNNVLTTLNNSVEKKIYNFRAEISPETRTTFNADFSGLQWNAGDVVGFYTNANDQNIQSTPVENGVFSAELSSEATIVYAYYPYSTDSYYWNTDFVLPVSQVQYQIMPGVFNGANLPMLAQAKLSEQGMTDLKFNPKGSVMAFNIYNPDDTSEILENISFTAKGNMTCGDWSLDWSTGQQGMLNYNRSTAMVGLINPKSIGGVSKPTNKTDYIYLVVASQNYDAGGTIAVTTNKTVYYFNYNNLDMSDVYNIKTLSLDLKNNAILKETVKYYGQEYFPDKIFREYVFDNFDANRDGRLSSSEVTVAEFIRCDNVASFKGIEIFKNLRYLICNSSQLTELDLKSNTLLEEVGIYCSQLENLDLSYNNNLKYLTVRDGSLANLNVSKNYKLMHLYCANNKLTKLDTKNNLELIQLDCGSNQLSSLDVSKNKKLDYLSCGNNKLKEINVADNTELLQLWCYENQLTSLDVTRNIKLGTLCCRNNSLQQLDLSKNQELTYLECSFNRLIKLDLSQNKKLLSLLCPYNLMKNLDVSHCAKDMDWMYCDVQCEYVDEQGRYINQYNPFYFTQAEDQKFNESMFKLPDYTEIKKVSVDR